MKLKALLQPVVVRVGIFSISNETVYYLLESIGEKIRKIWKSVRRPTFIYFNKILQYHLTFPNFESDRIILTKKKYTWIGHIFLTCFMFLLSPFFLNPCSLLKICEHPLPRPLSYKQAPRLRKIPSSPLYTGSGTWKNSELSFYIEAACELSRTVGLSPYSPSSFMYIGSYRGRGSSKHSELFPYAKTMDEKDMKGDLYFSLVESSLLFVNYLLRRVDKLFTRKK